MSTLSHSENRTIGRFLADSVQTIRAHVEARMADANERRQVAYELSTYSDNELAGLGINRADISAIAAGTYRR